MFEPVPIESFTITKRIAVGGYGIVDEGVGPNDERVAIKREVYSAKVTRSILEYEYNVYKALAGSCVPTVKAFGRSEDYNILVTELLGQTLDDIFKKCAKYLSFRTTATLALGALDVISYIHSRGFIHRDIKGNNFLLVLGASSHRIYIIDFGLARPWSAVGRSSDPSEVCKDAIGSLTYASIGAHLGQSIHLFRFFIHLLIFTQSESAQTRRDDLQSLAYMLLRFARGSPPWEKIRGGTIQHFYHRILEKKRSWTAERLCHGLPREFQMFSEYCLNMKIDNEPDYDLLRGLLKTLMNRSNPDDPFEWEKPSWESVLSSAESITGCFQWQDAALRRSLPLSLPLLDPGFLVKFAQVRIFIREHIGFLTVEIIRQRTSHHSCLFLRKLWPSLMLGLKRPYPPFSAYESDDDETRIVHGGIYEDYSLINYVVEMQPCGADDLSPNTPTVNLDGLNGWISETMRTESIIKKENWEDKDSLDPHRFLV